MGSNTQGQQSASDLSWAGWMCLPFKVFVVLLIAQRGPRIQWGLVGALARPPSHSWELSAEGATWVLESFLEIPRCGSEGVG